MSLWGSLLLTHIYRWAALGSSWQPHPEEPPALLAAHLEDAGSVGRPPGIEQVVLPCAHEPLPCGGTKSSFMSPNQAQQLDPSGRACPGCETHGGDEAATSLPPMRQGNTKGSLAPAASIAPGGMDTPFLAVIHQGQGWLQDICPQCNEPCNTRPEVEVASMRFQSKGGKERRAYRRRRI